LVELFSDLLGFMGSVVRSQSSVITEPGGNLVVDIGGGGKYVVLEWHNQGCPYTQKHYESGNMQRLQKEWTGRGVEWFTVISSAPGMQAYVDANTENSYLAKMHAVPTAALLDPSGELGHLYGAKTTPHIFVIDPQDRLIYDGAVDDRPTTDLSDVTNYVSQAVWQ
jgi:hypothetical protein